MAVHFVLLTFHYVYHFTVISCFFVHFFQFLLRTMHNYYYLYLPNGSANIFIINRSIVFPSETFLEEFRNIEKNTESKNKRK